jgi:beta-galactosidase
LIEEPRDYALVFLDGEKIATLDRRRNQRSVLLPVRRTEMRLDVLVEAMGRIDFGDSMRDRKGITEQA